MSIPNNLLTIYRLEKREICTNSDVSVLMLDMAEIIKKYEKNVSEIRRLNE